jgi:hypothetical protein
MKDTFDTIMLSKAIKGCSPINLRVSQRYRAADLHHAKKHVCTLYQSKELTDAHFLDIFQTTSVALVEHYTTEARSG